MTTSLKFDLENIFTTMKSKKIFGKTPLLILYILSFSVYFDVELFTKFCKNTRLKDTIIFKNTEQITIEIPIAMFKYIK